MENMKKHVFKVASYLYFFIQNYDAKKAHHMLSLMERMKLGFDWTEFCYLVV
jgi:hypothetical protein